MRALDIFALEVQRVQDDREPPRVSVVLSAVEGSPVDTAMHDLVDELEGAINALQDELDARRAFTVSAGHA